MSNAMQFKAKIKKPGSEKSYTRSSRPPELYARAFIGKNFTF